MNSRHVLLGLSLFLTVASTSAQVNDKGTFHASIGIVAGRHATEYQQTFTLLGIPLTERSTDGAATVT